MYKAKLNMYVCPWYRVIVIMLFFSNVCEVFFFLTTSRSQSHEGEFWSMLVVGLPLWLGAPCQTERLQHHSQKQGKRLGQGCSPGVSRSNWEGLGGTAPQTTIRRIVLER